jgi:pimeloyl-ACP methyl ester carboxylesterase
MRTTTIQMAVIALVVAVAILASGCGGSDPQDRPAGQRSETSTPRTTRATTAVERPTQPVDALVSVPGGRMYLRCVGQGTTTVLLVAGWDDGGDSWGAIEPAIAEQARVCSYARLGTGTSDPQPTTQTFATQAADLHALLEAAGEPGPYVVLGHSFGGAESVTFAAQHPDEVVGLLLLDASPVTWPATACSVADDGSETARSFAQGCALMKNPAADPERLDAFPAFAEVAAITSLGDLPMTVMSAAHRTLPGLAPTEATRLNTVWDDGVRHWASLSTASTVVTVEDTGHHIEVDQPAQVIDQVVALLQRSSTDRERG